MESSILNSTKHILGLQDDYLAFDLDVITHINTAFSTLNQLGVGPTDAFSIDSAENNWDELDIPQNQMSMIRTYVFLKARMLFDPPATSFLIEASNNQIKELEWRLNALREDVLPEEVV